MTKYGRKSQKMCEKCQFEPHFWGLTKMQKRIKKCVFGVKTFFQVATEFFWCVQHTCYRYLKGRPKLALSIAPKIRAIRHLYQKISRKNEKKDKKKVPWVALYI